MEVKTIEELEKKYDLELEKVVDDIRKSRARVVLLQFADGLKPWATAVVDFLREKTSAEFLIWFGSCFGACDTPVLGKDLEKEIDLVVQFGHNELIAGY